MRRKVFQDFANVFCQKFLQIPSGYDLASFVYYGSGRYSLNILNGDCYFDETKIPTLKTCTEHKEWLEFQIEKYDFSLTDIKFANLEVIVEISDIKIEKMWKDLYSAMAHFAFDCKSEIQTSEKSYFSKMIHAQKWGFDYYYEKLYGRVNGIINPILKV